MWFLHVIGYSDTHHPEALLYVPQSTFCLRCEWGDLHSRTAAQRYGSPTFKRRRCTWDDCLRCSSRCARMSLNTFAGTTLFYFVPGMSQRVEAANAAMSDKVQRENEISPQGGLENILPAKENKKNEQPKATVSFFVFDGIPLGKAPIYFEPWLKPTGRRRHSPKTGCHSQARLTRVTSGAHSGPALSDNRTVRLLTLSKIRKIIQKPCKHSH